MITSLAFVFLIGLTMASVCRACRLPRIIGMLVTGVLLGPFVLDVLDPSLLGISSELRQIALIIILIKAGLALDVSDLKKVGRPGNCIDFRGTFVTFGGRVALSFKNAAKYPRTSVLCDCLPAKGNRAGGHRFGAAVTGTAVR